MNVGEKIRKLRIEKMMTQSELSGDQVTRNMLSLIEKGKAVPSLQTLSYIATRLNVSTAFLLADENEEYMLIKNSRIADIRLAFKNANYRICMDMCMRFADTEEKQDDEILLIMAESALEIAKEELYSDRVRSAWNYLDMAVLYASQTIYNTEHIKAVSGLIFDYLSELSPSLISDNMDVELFVLDSAKAFIKADSFCKYIMMLKDKGFEGDIQNEAYELHVECRRLIEKGEFDKANSLLNNILKIDERLPGVLLYHVFADLEDCCRRLGNSKNARMYSDEKVTQLERILS